MQRAVARFDWSTTSLGTRTGWSAAMEPLVGVVLENRFPMLLMWGPDLIQVYNDAFIPIMGERHPAALGQPARDCWHDIWSDVGPLLLGVYERGDAVFFENLPLLMERNGRREEVFFTFTYTPVRERDVVCGLLCVATETTSHVLREREAAERVAALAELDRAKTQFFNNVSHEFRVPLTLMLGPLEELVRTLPEYEQRQTADLARRNAIRLQKLVNSLLDFSAVQSGMVERHDEPVDVAQLTRDLVAEFRSAYDRAGLDLRADCAPGPPIAVDRLMYEKIVLNLLSNALKFTFSGGVEVVTRFDAETLVLRVRDTGIGIAEADLPSIFERFRRVHGARSRTHEGSGIGLALVHEFVTLLGGTIDVESRVDAGTTFTLRIPARPAAGSLFAADDTALRQSFREEAEGLVRGVEAETPSPNPIATARILVADDNADLRSYLRRLLAPRYEVTLVTNGAELLRRLHGAERPDLVILDVMMPTLDGFATLAAIRDDPETAGLPVLLLSARAGDEAASDALRQGADEYIVKPFVAADLLARIENLLRRVKRTGTDGVTMRHTRDRREAALVAAAAERFVGSSDSAAVAEAIAQTLAPAFADWCIVYAADGETLAPAALVHEERAKADLGRMIERRYPHRVGDGSAVAAAFAGVPQFAPRITGEMLTALARDPEHARILETLDLASAIVVPVGAGAAAIAVIRAGTRAPFDERDLAFVTSFAEHAALALRSVRARERDRTIALTLQRAMLPSALPDVDGLRFSASYAPAVHESLIGGDWYDAFILEDGRVCLSIGDVVGHGLDAATSMAALRQALRTLAGENAAPGELLARLNRLLIRDDGHSLATAVVATIDPRTLEVVIASAGHPPPILLRRKDDAALDVGGLMLGVAADATFAERRLRLQAGDLLAFYTDGYVENERELEHGERRLLAALRRVHGLREPAARVHLDVFGDAAPRDDAALLIVEVDALLHRLDVVVPARRDAVAGARAAVQRFLATTALDADQQFGLLVAVGEAVINAVEHAYDHERGTLALSGSYENGVVEVCVEDAGAWETREGAPPVQRGYGLPLMHALADVSIERMPSGTRVRLSAHAVTPATR